MFLNEDGNYQKLGLSSQDTVSMAQKHTRFMGGIGEVLICIEAQTKKHSGELETSS